MIQIGVIGAGRMGTIHAENIQKRIEGARVCAAAKRSISEQTRAWAGALGIDRLYTDAQTLIDDPQVDAVVITTPVPTHKDLCLAAIRAGKHVLCEKPLDVEPDNILKIQHALRQSGVKFQLGFNRRFDPDYARAAAAIRTGVLGRIFMIKLTSKDLNPPPYSYVATSGGQILDSAIHEIDLVHFLAQDEIEEVSAVGSALIDPKLAEYGDTDVLLLTLRMRGGAYAVIDIARKSPAGADRRLEIFGEKQILQVANNRADLLTALDGSGTQTAAPTDGLVRFAASWQREMQAFVDCIAHDTVPAVGAEDGLRSIRAAQALNLALRERRVVRLDELG